MRIARENQFDEAAALRAWKRCEESVDEDGNWRDGKNRLVVDPRTYFIRALARRSRPVESSGPPKAPDRPQTEKRVGRVVDVSDMDWRALRLPSGGIA